MSSDEFQARQAIRHVADVFSNLADEFKVAEQMPLFTQDAVVNTYIGGELVFEMNGQAQIEQTFKDYLFQFQKAYHLNGQQTVEFRDETHAKAVLYCLVKLVKEENGKATMLEHSVRYTDEFVRNAQGKWQIAKRVAEFLISETRELQG